MIYHLETTGESQFIPITFQDIRCINRLVEPSSGKVMLGDVNLAALSKADLRH
jgi:hypothetical protein